MSYPCWWDFSSSALAYLSQKRNFNAEGYVNTTTTNNFCIQPFEHFDKNISKVFLGHQSPSVTSYIVWSCSNALYSIFKTSMIVIVRLSYLVIIRGMYCSGTWSNLPIGMVTTYVCRQSSMTISHALHFTYCYGFDYPRHQHVDNNITLPAILLYLQT